MVARIDFAGQKYGKWTILRRSDKKQKWFCECECGTIKDVYVTSLQNGTSTNCGCVKRKHGYEGTKVYRLWAHMKERCISPKHKSFSDYGGRGISVCDGWLEAKVFIEWAIENGYQEGLTLDRIDTNGNYTPENCRFVTNLDQQNNKRNNRFIEIKGESKTIAEWSRIAGIGPKVLRHRIEADWKEEDLLEPVIKYRTRK